VHYIRKHSYKSELLILVLWFMRRRYLNDPTLFLHFCDYPPFEEDLDFIWINLNSHHARNVWLKLARCFILKDSFQYTNVKKVSPLVSPTLTLIFECHLRKEYMLKSKYKYRKYKIHIFECHWDMTQIRCVMIKLTITL
jgi:hypothetical protein